MPAIGRWRLTARGGQYAATRVCAHDVTPSPRGRIVGHRRPSSAIVGHRPPGLPGRGRVGAGLLWAGGVLARALDEAHDIFDEGSTTAHGVPLILPDPETYDAPEWMT